MGGRSDIPVAVGEHDPRAGLYMGGAPHVYGKNGVGDVRLLKGVEAATEHAAEMLIRLAKETPGTLNVIAIGPLTNIARALDLEPELPNLIGTLTIMGGAVWDRGNITPAAEANIYHDAEAARNVFRAGFDLVLVPLDVTRQHKFGQAEVEVLGESGSDLLMALGEMLKSYINFYETKKGERHAPLHDPLAAEIAIGDVAPTEIKSVVIDVPVSGTERGRTVVNEQPGRRPCRVVVTATDTAAANIRDRIMETPARIPA